MGVVKVVEPEPEEPTVDDPAQIPDDPNGEEPELPGVTDNPDDPGETLPQEGEQELSPSEEGETVPGAEALPEDHQEPDAGSDLSEEQSSAQEDPLSREEESTQIQVGSEDVPEGTDPVAA